MTQRLVWFVFLVFGNIASAEPRRAKVPAAATTCNEPSACALYPSDCCGDCGEFTPENVVAYNAEWIAEHAQPGCGGADCPKCTQAEEDIPQRQHQLVATCEKKKCVVKKLDQMPITRCTRDVQCVVATPACCACDWSNSVAIRADRQDELRQLACTSSPNGVGCPACAKIDGKPHVQCKRGRCALKIVKTNDAGTGLLR